MTVVRVKAIKMVNFKGSAKEEYNLDADVVTIKATNGKGKSRIREGFNWNLTGKDTEDRKDYDIKDNTNLDRNKMDHEVEVMLEADKIPVNLRRIYAEVYQRVAGSDIPTLKGHETSFFKNDVPYKATQYQELVRTIAPEKLIKLLSNPWYFPELPWKEQREELIAIAGSVESSDVISLVPEEKRSILKAIIDDMASKATEEGLQEKADTYKAKKDKITEQLSEIKIRIEEKLRDRPTESASDFEVIEKQLAELKKQDDRLVDDITNVTNKGAEKINAYYAKVNEVNTIKAEANQIFINKKLEYKTKAQNKESEKSSLLSQVDSLITSNATTSRLRDQDQAQVDRIKKEIESVKTQFEANKAKTFTLDKGQYPTGGGKCQFCGSDMPHIDHDWAAIEKQQLEAFNTSKSQEEARLRKLATEKKEAITPLEASIKKSEEMIRHNSSLITNLRGELESMDSFEVPSDEAILLSVKEDKEYQELIKKAEKLESILPSEPAKVDTDELKAQREELSTKIDEIKAKLSKRDTIKEIDQRVEELETQQSTLSQQRAKIEQGISALDAYSDAKMKIVEERVNGMFEEVSFNLFDKQVNGVIKPFCEMWYLNRPYRSLSTGQKVVAGMYCIKGLSKFHNTYLPVWVENSESAFDLPEMDSQVIRLFADEDVKTLQFSYKSK